MHAFPQGVPVISTAAPAAIEQSRPVICTVAQFAERNPAFSEPSVRNLIFKGQPRQSSRGEIAGNGLLESGAIIRLGRRVLIDEGKFLTWVSLTGAQR